MQGGPQQGTAEFGVQISGQIQINERLLAHQQVEFVSSLESLCVLGEFPVEKRCLIYQEFLLSVILGEQLIP